MKNINIKFFVLFFVLSAFFSGCYNKDSSKSPSLTDDKQTLLKKDAPGSSPEQLAREEVTKQTSGKITDDKMPLSEPKNRMIIKTGVLSLEIEKFDDTEKRITETVKKYNGYVSSSSSNLTGIGKKQGNIVLKVPAEKYDALVAEVSGFGKVMSQNINSSDVTEEFIDLEARAKTQKELEQRLIKLLAERTARLTDVVEVEEKLAAVRQKIESIEGRMRFLKTQSDFSTLTVSLFEPSLLETSSGGGFWYEITQGFKSGLKGFTEIIRVIITVSIALIPIILFLGILFYIIRLIIKRKKKNI